MDRVTVGLIGCMLCGLPVVVPAQQGLYDNANFHAYTNDQRAYRIGDSLTVVVVEAASASSSANTQTKKATDMSAAAAATWDSTNHNASAKLGLSDDFTGKGSIERSGKLAAQITVTVTGITGNGELLVSGRQVIAVNNEKQEIALKGRVRPYDIMANNSVLSSRLADASISYIGEGWLAEQQHPGFLSRILMWLGL
jgi:flagellar L-ring protein precursor FlgH